MDTVKTSLKIRKDLWRAARMLAAGNDMGLDGIVNLALKELLHREWKPRRFTVPPLPNAELLENPLLDPGPKKGRAR